MRVKLVQHWESSWLNIESQNDSTFRVKLTQHCKSNWLKYSQVTHFARSNYNSASDFTFKVKDSNFSSASDSNFLVKMTQFFSIGALREKLSHFDLKSWVKFQLNHAVTQLFEQNDPIFSLGALSKKIQSFWPKKFGRF